MGRDGRRTVALVVVLALVAASVSFAVLGPTSSSSSEDRFWSYVQTHTPAGAEAMSRREALEFAASLCADAPVSNLEARDPRMFFDEMLGAVTNPRRKAEWSAAGTTLDAALTYLCPVTKHLPEHPRHDLVAGFPLPKGSELDSDPVLGRADDDSLLDTADDPDFRLATYLPPEGMDLAATEQFYADRVGVGAPWRDWRWCRVEQTTELQSGGGDLGTTYVFANGDRRLYLQVHAVRDDLVHARGTVLIDVSVYGPPFADEADRACT